MGGVDIGAMMTLGRYRKRAEAAEDERDHLARRVAELEAERARYDSWRMNKELHEELNTAKRSLQQATEALREIADMPPNLDSLIVALMRNCARQALAALAGEDDGEPYRYVRGEALMTERKKKPPDPQREGDYL